ncbi:MAG: type II toxin-antitoxin system HicA family toxin [Bryobacterales bacterium]|nr:type II toxin-antitoxin system HicA family toxin [Bryobacterales bacterium]
MSNWPATKARRVLAAFERTGWRVKRQRGSHRLLAHPTWPDYEFSFPDQDEIGPRMLARIAKRTGLMPDDL